MFEISIQSLEKCLIGLIAIVLMWTYIPDRSEGPVPEYAVPDSLFNDFPLVAWKSTHEKWNGEPGDVVRIKYRVTKEDTRVRVVDEYGTEVHMQPFHRNPKDDGTPRDFTYVWMLYKTERTAYISPGEYKILVYHGHQHNVIYHTWITI